MNNNRKYTQRPRKPPREWYPIYLEQVEVWDDAKHCWLVRRFMIGDDPKSKYIRRYYPTKGNKDERAT